MSLVLRKVKVGYQLGDLRGKVNHLLFMDDPKLYGQNEKQIDTLVKKIRIFAKDIGVEFGISKCARRKEVFYQKDKVYSYQMMNS